jgi:hypothetical protein
MKPMRIRLDLSRHCIETAIRKRYHRLVGRALRDKAWTREMEAEVELLKSALETFDFGRLRTGFKELAGHTTDRVELEEEDPGQPRIRINGKPVGSSQERQ